MEIRWFGDEVEFENAEELKAGARVSESVGETEKANNGTIVHNSKSRTQNCRLFHKSNS